MTPGYTALRTAVACLDLTGRGEIFATGRDRVRLLHNLSSNDIKQLTPGTGCYAFFLSPQGRIQADANILALPDRFLLDTEPETRAKLLAQIRKYIIADDVTLDDAGDRLAVVALEGPESAAILARLGAPAPEADYAHAAWNETIVARISATGAPGFRLFLPAEHKPALLAQLQAAGVPAATPEDARVVRLEHGIPRYGEDITESSLPQETQQMRALSFTKGCYLGQEIVERIRSRGHVNRLLRRLEFAEGEQPEGEITSSVFSPALGKWVALAYVRVR